MKWHIEQAFDRTGAYQMQRDEELALAMRDDPGREPVLRLYTWQPYAVSLGFQQKSDDIDAAQCAAHGIDIVRRPTGGRAVYHSEELTYAVIMTADPSQSIAAVHNVIAGALLHALQPLAGGELRMTSARDGIGIRDTYQSGKPTNIACFASTSRYEITYHGKKLVGSAQRRFGNAVLQHGSILIGAEHLRLADLLAIPESQRQQTHALMQRETVTLNEIAGRTITASEVAALLEDRFKIEQVQAPKLAPAELSSLSKRSVERDFDIAQQA